MVGAAHLAVFIKEIKKGGQFFNRPPFPIRTRNAVTGC